MLDTRGYKHTLRICNTSFLRTATMAAPTRSFVTLSCILPILFIQFFLLLCLLQAYSRIAFFFCTIMLLFLNLFCAVLLLVGCNLPKACKTNIRYEYNVEYAGISVEKRMTVKKLRIVERHLAAPINSTFSLSVCLFTF